MVGTLTDSFSLTQSAEEHRFPVDSDSLKGVHFSKGGLKQMDRCRKLKGYVRSKPPAWDQSTAALLNVEGFNGTVTHLGVFVLKSIYRRLWHHGMTHNLVPRLVISQAGSCKKKIHPHMYISDMLERDSKQSLLVVVGGIISRLQCPTVKEYRYIFWNINVSLIVLTYYVTSLFVQLTVTIMHVCIGVVNWPQKTP